MREALEQVYGLDALERVRSKNRPQQTPRRDVREAPAQVTMDGETLPAPVSGGRFRVNNTEEGRAFADAPHLTGDAEWDALELSETDPSKPPLRFAMTDEDEPEEAPRPGAERVGALLGSLPRGDR
jgi:hypothetical protein